MSKTAMQIAIEYIDQCLNALDTKDMLINLLEKEKEQLEEARLKGYGEGYNEGIYDAENK
jgi:predicted Rdx family selenoprotein